MSVAVIPMVPESVFCAHREASSFPSTITFMVNAAEVYSPQTGHPWFVEMDHEMGSPSFYSLVPQKSDNLYVAHYRVETRRPRLNGDFKFMDAWLTTNHTVCGHVHFSRTFFNPERANDKLYFNREPKPRIEVIVPGQFIGDREIFQILEPFVPKEYRIESLLQRQS